jgi:hypothetical protein
MPRSVFDIFLSSTSVDLKPAREKVSEMVGRMRQTTIKMETFGAQPNKPLDTCRAEVQRCDALIVIAGHRYGWVPGKKEGGDGIKSITWWEVQWALAAKKPVYAFLFDPNESWAGEREQDRLTGAKKDSEIIEIGHAVQHLQKFRKFLESETTREVFTSADDLGGKVATSLHEWLLQQAVAAARASYAQDEGGRLVPQPAEAGGEGSLAGFDQLYWQEQVHLLSAQQIAGEGKGVRIALVGARPDIHHPALAGSSIRYFNLRPDAKDQALDDYTTAMASLLVGNGGGYRGVAPKAQLLAINVLGDDLSARTSDMLVALDAAVRERAQVCCMAFAGPPSDTEKIVYGRVAQMGLVTVCAAGNDGGSEPSFPAGYPDCVAAGAVDSNNRLAVFTNRGNWVTTNAPGVDIPAAIGKKGYRLWSGTSFSCAILTGIVTLMLKVNPKLNTDRVRELLRKSATPSSDGTQVVNAFHAVKKAAKAVKRKPVKKR